MIAPATGALIHKLQGLAPRVALVLGSGLGSLVDAVENAIRIPYADLPGFPHSGVSGHAGEVVAGYLSGKPVLMLAGRAHYYEKGDAAVMRPVMAALADLGIEMLILTNAAGSVHQLFRAQSADRRSLRSALCRHDRCLRQEAQGCLCHRRR